MVKLIPSEHGLCPRNRRVDIALGVPSLLQGQLALVLNDVHLIDLDSTAGVQVLIGVSPSTECAIVTCHVVGGVHDLCVLLIVHVALLRCLTDLISWWFPNVAPNQCCLLKLRFNLDLRTSQIAKPIEGVFGLCQMHIMGIHLTLLEVTESSVGQCGSVDVLARTVTVGVLNPVLFLQLNLLF